MESNKSRKGQQDLASSDNALREVRGVSLATQLVDGFVPKKLDQGMMGGALPSHAIK
jgi:hypothetical protein